MANLINPSKSMSYISYSYDQWTSSAYTNVNPNEQIAVRFSPINSGQVTGALFHPFISNNITSPLYFEIWSNQNGLPGSKLGNSVSIDPAKISLYSWNFVDLQNADVNLIGGTDYHLVAYFTSGTATGLMIDNGSPDSRSSRNGGSSWVLKTNYDFRLRPIAVMNSTPTSVQTMETLPASYALYNNYPNPFNPSTLISYQLPQKSSVQLVVYDILGREVAVLVNEDQPAGSYKISFNARQTGGAPLPSGVYFYSLRAGDFIQTKKMILLK